MGLGTDVDQATRNAKTNVKTQLPGVMGVMYTSLDTNEMVVKNSATDTRVLLPESGINS